MDDDVSAAASPAPGDRRNGDAPPPGSWQEWVGSPPPGRQAGPTGAAPSPSPAPVVEDPAAGWSSGPAFPAGGFAAGAQAADQGGETTAGSEWQPWAEPTAPPVAAAVAPAPVSGAGAEPPEDAPGPVAGDPGRRRRHRWVIEWAVVLVVALAVALGIRAFVVQTFFIPSASMEPTLMIGDRILVDKISYRLHSPHRGDMVVFGRPPGENSPADIKDLVKRIVGLPGETIWSVNGHIFVQGWDTGNHAMQVGESYLPPGTQLGTPIARTSIPKNDYFVMGDNRSNSQDSRFFGPIPRSLIVGKVVMRIWPISHLHWF